MCPYRPSLGYPVIVNGLWNRLGCVSKVRRATPRSLRHNTDIRHFRVTGYAASDGDKLDAIISHVWRQCLYCSVHHTQSGHPLPYAASKSAHNRKCRWNSGTQEWMQKASLVVKCGDGIPIPPDEESGEGLSRPQKNGLFD